MTRLKKVRRNIFRFSLVVPCFASLFLGMFTATAIRYTQQQNMEKQVFITNILFMPLKTLSEYEI